MPLVHTPENPDIGAPCPSFELPAVDGNSYSLESFKDSKVLAVMFICNHCPYVVAVEDRLLALARSYKTEDVQFVAVCSNDAEKYPEDSFEGLKKRWIEKEYSFPYLHDESQNVAKIFGAVCTPDFFVYDQERKLAYRGRLDDSWKEPEKVTHEEMREAIDQLVAGGGPVENQTPSMGCSMKWKEQ